MATDDAQTTKISYAEMIDILQELHTKLEPWVNPNSEIRQALNRDLKDLPKDDNTVQIFAKGLIYSRNINNTVENYIRILQQVDEGGAIADGN